jgi:hypothetical protein
MPKSRLSELHSEGLRILISSSSDYPIFMPKHMVLLVIHEILTKTMLLTKKHQTIAPLYNENFRENL